jgi:hypothetical protein
VASQFGGVAVVSAGRITASRQIKVSQDYRVAYAWGSILANLVLDDNAVNESGVIEFKMVGDAMQNVQLSGLQLVGNDQALNGPFNLHAKVVFIPEYIPPLSSITSKLTCPVIGAYSTSMTSNTGSFVGESIFLSGKTNEYLIRTMHSKISMGGNPFQLKLTDEKSLRFEIGTCEVKFMYGSTEYVGFPMQLIPADGLISAKMLARPGIDATLSSKPKVYLQLDTRGFSHNLTVSEGSASGFNLCRYILRPSSGDYELVDVSLTFQPAISNQLYTFVSDRTGVDMGVKILLKVALPDGPSVFKVDARPSPFQILSTIYKDVPYT